jgi:hypothetical protein
LNPTLDDSHVKAKFDNLATTDFGLSFSYEPRVYFATNSAKRDKGMITVVRNYLKFKQAIAPGMSITLSEIPIVHVYDSAGTAAGANPTLENRVYLEYDYDFGNFSFSFPIMLNSTKYRDFQVGAVNNNQTNHLLWIWPELDYNVSKNFTVGIAFRSDNLAQPDLKALTLKSGFENGVAQAMAKVSL